MTALRPQVRRTILITVFMVMAFGASSAWGLLLSTKPAWDGWMRAGQTTEVTIRVVEDRGGPLTLTLSDQSISYTHSTNLEPDIEFVWRVPLSPPSGESLRLVAQFDEEPVIEREIILRRHLAASPLVAVLADQPLLLEGIQAANRHVSADSLPFSGPGFAAMDLVVIHRNSLRNLKRQQLTALRQHAMQCGRIVIIGFVPTAIAMFEEFAGCGGRFLVAAETSADLDTVVAGLLEAQVPQLPSQGSLRTLFDSKPMARQIRPLAAFFAIYLCVLLIAIRSRRATPYFIGASTAATLIGLIAWTMSPETIDRLSWTEMENQTGAARYTSVFRVLGNGGRVTFDIPQNGGALQAVTAANPVLVSVGKSDGAAHVNFETLLFSQHEFLTSGATTLPLSLVVEHSGDLPRITNRGGGRSPPALLAWNDLKYAVPPLAPDDVWRPASEPEPWGTSHAERLFRKRAMQAPVALFVEFPAGGQPVANGERSYLVVWP